MTRVADEADQRQALHDQDLIVTLTYERDQAVATLERISALNPIATKTKMRGWAKDCLRDLRRGRADR